MKFTLAEIKSMRPSLFKLVRQDGLPAKISYRLGKFLNSYSKEYMRLEDERIKLIQKYGEEPNEKGDQKVKDENQAVFAKEFEELLKEETDLDITETIKLSELGDIKLSPLDFSVLQKIIEDK